MAQQAILPLQKLACATFSHSTVVCTSAWRRYTLRVGFCLVLTLVCLAQDMVSVVVTLNRCMYAQLEQQEFQAPPGFSIPPAKSPQHSAAQRGMKLAVGLEMLYARSRASGVCPDTSQAHRQAAIPLPACWIWWLMTDEQVFACKLMLKE